ncbi:MAG: DinB family protein [Anaerolineae bacterium]|nr:DinB family protein [Anaerolineae bacterium]
MEKQETERLIRLLDDAYNETMSVFNRADSNAIAYADMGWSVKDVLSHIAAWDVASVDSLRAYQNGQEHAVVGAGKFASDDEFNRHNYEQRKDRDAIQIHDEWAAARNQIKAELRQIPADKLAGTIRCPWGARSSVSSMIEEIVKHEAEHRDSLRALAR